MDRDTDIFQTYHLARYEDSSVKRYAQDFVREEPLLICMKDKPYSIVMRTPGDEIAHAAGLCLAEGLVEVPEDIAAIEFDSELDKNRVSVNLKNGRNKLVSEKLDRGIFLGQTACGICGKNMIKDLVDNLNIFKEESAVTYRQVMECVEKFLKHQEHYIRTRGTHAVMLFDSRFHIIVKAEDVGRHNAMDKAIGTLFLRNRIYDTYLAVLSSRISFETIKKAARAGIPILISITNPTSMAVELASKLNMTLVCLDKKSGFIVPCGEKRIRPNFLKGSA
ncbi:MAG: formate dehydrogenase accessory sulfurtransferase FdhD [Deltaproteobacteria bacterium]|nr:formate dehydrogenase accessory sulfurtransferase FdhD [Deltaproteobacteria bacterium]